LRTRRRIAEDAMVIGFYMVAMLPPYVLHISVNEISLVEP
jgi:hypothetical protein